MLYSSRKDGSHPPTRECADKANQKHPGLFRRESCIVYVFIESTHPQTKKKSECNHNLCLKRNEPRMLIPFLHKNTINKTPRNGIAWYYIITCFSCQYSGDCKDFLDMQVKTPKRGFYVLRISRRFSVAIFSLSRWSN